MTNYLDEYIEAILKAYNNMSINIYLLALDNCQMKDKPRINAKMYEEMQSLKDKIEEINRIYNIASYEKGGRNNGRFIHHSGNNAALMLNDGTAENDHDDSGKDS